MAFTYHGSVAPCSEINKCADKIAQFYITPYAIDRGASSSLGFYNAAILNGGAFFGCYALGLIADSGLGIFNSVVAGTLACAVVAFAWIGTHSIPGVIVWAVAYGIVSGALQAIFSPCVSALGPTAEVIGSWNGEDYIYHFLLAFLMWIFF